MYSKLIEEQLSKVMVADLSNYEKDTNTYFIPKVSTPCFDVDKCYIIALNDNIIGQNENSLLISNWNNGSYPTEKYYIVDIVKKLGKMIKVVGLGYDMDKKSSNNISWNGWLPTTELKIIETL